MFTSHHTRIISLILLTVMFSAYMTYPYLARAEGESATPAESSESDNSSEIDSSNSSQSPQANGDSETTSEGSSDVTSENTSEAEHITESSVTKNKESDQTEIDVDTESETDRDQDISEDTSAQQTETSENQESVTENTEQKQESTTQGTTSEQTSAAVDESTLQNSEQSSSTPESNIETHVDTATSTEQTTLATSTEVLSSKTSTSTLEVPQENTNAHGGSSQAFTETEPTATTTATSTFFTPSVLAANTATTTATTTATSTEPDIVSTATTTLPTLATSTASTTIDHGTSTPTIISGTSVALANILNLVNSNLINSEGVFLFSNFFEAVKGSIDFRGYLENIRNGCGLGPCTAGEEIAVSTTNEGNIDNDITVVATSGNNTIDEAGTATIDTGDAYAGLNLINMLNTNVVDSEYLVVTLNAFQNVDGDVVFPSLSEFFSSLAGGAGPTQVSVTGTANVDNTVDVQAQTGNNQTDSNESSITTGEAQANTNVFNGINTTLVGGQNISILFKVHGNWAGDVFGAPPGLAWTEGPDGSIYLFDTTSASSGLGQASTTIVSSSTGSIHNNVMVTALTGDNQISNANSAVISTGNAYAGANIVNVANQNIVSRNWILAVINIFGDFNGNIAFGRPDLWIGQQVETPEKVKRGSELTYKLTLINNGDADASEVLVSNEYDADKLEILSSSAGYSIDGSGRMLWNIPTLQAGEAAEITYTARVKESHQGKDITNISSAHERESDNDLSDNSDSLTVTTYQRDRKEPRQKEEVVHRLSSVAFEVDRQTEYSTSTRDTEIPQKLIVRNASDFDAQHVVLNDFVRDSQGKIINHESWQLGTILAGEEITITYNVKFGHDAPFGTYTLSTIFTDNTPEYQKFINNGTIELVDVPAEIHMPVAPLIKKTSTSTEDTVSATPDIGEPMIAHAAEIHNTAAAGDTSPLGRMLWAFAATIVSVLSLAARKFFV